MQWLSRRPVRWLVLVLILIGVVVGTGYSLINRRASPVAFEDSYTAILRQHNWTPREAPNIVTVTLPSADELPLAMAPPWSLYLGASREIGLDFTSYAGQTLPLRVYQLSGEPNENQVVRGFLLVADERVVGAWLDVEQGAPGLYPLNTKPEALVP